MHELAITEGVVDGGESVCPGQVTCVRLEIGALSGVVADSLRFCFDLVTEGTSLEGAAWRSSRPPAPVPRAGACGADFEPDRPIRSATVRQRRRASWCSPAQDLAIVSVEVA